MQEVETHVKQRLPFECRMSDKKNRKKKKKKKKKKREGDGRGGESAQSARRKSDKRNQKLINCKEGWEVLGTDWIWSRCRF